MLNLATIANRIERLEQAEYSDQDEAFSTWIQLVHWAALPSEMHEPASDGRTKWKPEDFNKVYHGWWVFYFAPLLPGNEAEITWYTDKVRLCFETWLDTALEGYTPARLCNLDAMNECLSFVADRLVNEDWTWFNDQKREEIDFHNNRIQYQSDFTNGTLTEIGAAWLRENGEEFLAMKSAKQDIEEAIKRAMSKPLKPLQQDPERLERVIERIEVLTSPQPESPAVVNNAPVRVRYAGNQPPNSYQIQTVDGFRGNVKGQEYLVTPQVYANLVEFYKAGDWVKA